MNNPERHENSGSLKLNLHVKSRYIELDAGHTYRQIGTKYLKNIYRCLKYRCKI